MTRSTIAAAIFASLILLILTGHAFSADVSSLVGDWQGTLDPEGNSLRLVIHITSDSAERLKVTSTASIREATDFQEPIWFLMDGISAFSFRR